jgi:hypothetical protein
MAKVSFHDQAGASERCAPLERGERAGGVPAAGRSYMITVRSCRREGLLADCPGAHPLDSFLIAGRLDVEGPYRFWCNGRRAWEVSGFKDRRGYFGLQAEGAPMDFRKIRIKEQSSGDVSTDKK